MKPNIRVEIQNNLAEAMETEENEEGEISDDGIDMEAPKKLNLPEKQVKSSLISEMSDIVDQDKLQERARRFQLKPDELKNFTEQDLNVLHSSLGITALNETKINFEVVHVRGINRIDIFEYFLEYAPNTLETIDEECCNVVWTDKIAAARALHFLSKAVRGMPVRDDSSYFGNLEDGTEDQSILLINKNREVQLEEDDSGNNLLNETNSVDISTITTAIPPGYWRLGSQKGLLMRFGLKTDKKPVNSEPFKLYKRHTKKTYGIFGRNKDMNKPAPPSGDNPWSDLALNWDEDTQFREKERSPDVVPIPIKNQSLKVRLGSKRKEVEEDEAEEEEEEAEEKPKKVKIPRMRMYADEEEEKIKRKKMLTRIDQVIKKIDDNSVTDLRKVLNNSGRSTARNEPEPEVYDLGSKLKNRNKKMVFEVHTEVDKRENQRGRRFHSREATLNRHKKSRLRAFSDEEEEEPFSNKPRSKVAVVIKTHKKPSVASAVASSTVFSRVSAKLASSESDSDSEESSSTGSPNEIETVSKGVRRPGFRPHLRPEMDHKSPLKIEINNDHFKKH